MSGKKEQRGEMKSKDRKRKQRCGEETTQLLVDAERKNPGRTGANGDEGQSREKWQEESLIQEKP